MGVSLTGPVNAQGAQWGCNVSGDGPGVQRDRVDVCMCVCVCVCVCVCEWDVSRLGCGFYIQYPIFYTVYSIFYILYSIFYMSHILYPTFYILYSIFVSGQGESASRRSCKCRSQHPSRQGYFRQRCYHGMARQDKSSSFHM